MVGTTTAAAATTTTLLVLAAAVLLCRPAKDRDFGRSFPNLVGYPFFPGAVNFADKARLRSRGSLYLRTPQAATR